MNSAVTKRVLALVIGVVTMVMAIAPAAYAGESDGGSTHRRTFTTSGGSGGSGDSGSASGGVGAGAGGMAVTGGQDLMVPALLTGAGLLVLSAGGFAFRRRNEFEATGGINR
jgi:hypothetical protein